MTLKNNWKESHYRSLMKALSWRIWATATTALISYIVTGSMRYAFVIGFFEVISKITLYYLHERMWSTVFRVGIKLPQPLGDGIID